MKRFGKTTRLLNHAIALAKEGKEVLIWAATGSHKRFLESRIVELNKGGLQKGITVAVIGDKRMREVRFDEKLADHYTIEVHCKRLIELWEGK